jgi:DNA helicase-4
MKKEDEITSKILFDLNELQKQAVLEESKRILVLAGAGSGKTKTLIQKLLYLIFKKGISPSKILTITFTKNSINEIIDRLIVISDSTGEYHRIASDKKLSNEDKNILRKLHLKKYPWLSNLTISTFHGFCYNLLRKFGAKEFDNKFKILNDHAYDEEIESSCMSIEMPKQIFQKLLKTGCENIEYLLKLKRYILDYYVDDYRIKMNNRGYSDYEKPYTTLDGTNVRSKSERYIADWLYIHNIKYVYEPLINFKDFDFKPDFYIPEANIYLEHISNLSKEIKEKGIQFKIAEKLLIKTHESMTKDISTFYEYLEKNIFPRINPETLNNLEFSIESELKTYFQQVDEFLSMILIVNGKLKIETVDKEKVFEKALKDQHDRIKKFYELAKPLLENYHTYCIKKSYLDFNDLMSRGVSLLTNFKEIKNAFNEKFDYILVDEFQDVNTLQVKFLNCLLNENNQLFCVGDDWQSIYGWRGSEVDYIINFKKYFKTSKIIKLNLNYRNNEIITNATNQLIKKNIFKIEKEIHSVKNIGKKIFLYLSQKENEDGVKFVVDSVLKLLKKGYTKEDVLVLYRRTKSIEPYKNVLKGTATLRTMHSAKGLEAKIVFIIGLTGGSYGFPQIFESDRILQVIKPSSYLRSLEEERRLFYVAMTRAKEELFLISEIGNESSFIKDLPEELLEKNNFFILDFQNNANNICKNCNFSFNTLFNFCPNCGKKY